MQVAASRRQPTQRMFFALWPSANLQRELASVAQTMQVAFGGRVVATPNIHLTLAFLGSVPGARVDELLAIGASISASRFELNLSETGCWKRSAVGWIAPDVSPQPLEDLVLQLRQRLMQSRFRVDDKPFAPHVTLLRKAKCGPKPIQAPQASGQRQPLAWRIDQFVMMRSDTLQSGPEYTRVGVWPLN
jgi:2'-5' RNA ligase